MSRLCDSASQDFPEYGTEEEGAGASYVPPVSLEKSSSRKPKKHSNGQSGQGLGTMDWPQCSACGCRSLPQALPTRLFRTQPGPRISVRSCSMMAPFWIAASSRVTHWRNSSPLLTAQLKPVCCGNRALPMPAASSPAIWSSKRLRSAASCSALTASSTRQNCEGARRCQRRAKRRKEAADGRNARPNQPYLRAFCLRRCSVVEDRRRPTRGGRCRRSR